MRLPAEIYLMWTGVLHVYCLARKNGKNLVNIVIIANDDITG